MGNSAFPFGYRLPADAQRLRHKLLRHFARRPTALQCLSQCFGLFRLFLPQRLGPNVFPQRLDDQKHHVCQRRPYRNGQQKENDRCFHSDALLFCHQYNKPITVAPATITQPFSETPCSLHRSTMYVTWVYPFLYEKMTTRSGGHFGRGRKARTLDTRFWRPLLYQLSYTPMWWAFGDSNPGPDGYEPSALTN